MSVSPEESIAKLREALNAGSSPMITRFLLASIGGATPVMGGVLGASASLWAEQEQNEINQQVLQVLVALESKVREEGNTLVSKQTGQWVAARIRFAPATNEILESFSASSLTDNGVNDFTIHFTQALKPGFATQFYGSGPVHIESIEESATSVHVRFKDPLPAVVTFVFFNLDQPGLL